MYFLLLPHQLFDTKYLSKSYNYILWECPHYFKAYNYNKKKLLLHRASMQHYFDMLMSKGFNVSYYEYTKDIDRDLEYTMYNPLDKSDVIQLPQKVKIIDTPAILLTQDLLEKYRNKTNKYFFNAFYMWSKQQLNIIPKIQSQDKSNRNVLKKEGKIPQPFNIINKTSETYIEDAKTYIENHFANNCGSVENFMFPITHKDAQKWLQHFIKYKFKNFGTYQDFIDKDNPYLYHSLLSALLNIGLLCPSDVIKEIMKYKNITPINSFEGFIRQLFWREYQYYCYKYFDFTKKNYFGNNKKITKDWYNGTVGIDPIDDAIKEAFSTGYLHHIKRLMVIGNYMNLSEINPKDGFKWFMEFSCDAYLWVMHQNVYDMVFFISGGVTMRRPYLSSSNYIIKMSNYKKGDWCDIWDSKYKHFVTKNKIKLWKYRYYVKLQ